MRQCVYQHCTCGWDRRSRCQKLCIVLHHQETSTQPSRVIHISVTPSFWVWPQIDIPKRDRKLTFLTVTDTYVHTYILKIDSSFALTHSAIITCGGSHLFRRGRYVQSPSGLLTEQQHQYTPAEHHLTGSAGTSPYPAVRKNSWRSPLGSLTPRSSFRPENEATFWLWGYFLGNWEILHSM